VNLNEQHHRYLRLLGLDEPPNGLPGLRQLVMRQLCRVPFENVSKLLLFGRERQGRVTTLTEYLDGIEHHDLGGTCYTANPFFYQLLAALDYDVDLLGADMSTANVHTCIRVRLDGDEYHVDVGYAAPFRAPMRLRDLPIELRDGRLRYILGRSEEDGELTVGVYAGLDRIHGYRAHNQPRTPDFFRQTILDSYLPGKTFMTCLRISRFYEQGSVHLRDRVLTIESAQHLTERELHNMAELREAIEGPLAMPRCPIAEAVAVLEEVMGEPYFV
jgi:arylamine N-acetyltransferase